MTKNPLRFKRAIIDMSSVLWTCLLAGVDEQFGTKYDTGEVYVRGKNKGEKKIVTINSAEYGYANSVAHLKVMMRDLDITPHQMILVEEGENSKAERVFISSTYKSGRDKLPGQYEAFTAAMEMLKTTFLDLGACVVTQDGVESDDVLAYLATHLKGERWLIGAPTTAHQSLDDNGIVIDINTDPALYLERWVVSGDKDLAALVDPDNGVHHWRRGEVNTNPFGGFPNRYIPVYIALVGDTADKIPGVVGFGEAAWTKLVSTFGYESLPLFQKLLGERQLHLLSAKGSNGKSDIDELPELKKVVEQADSAYTSYELACLRPESVNTKRSRLRWTVGVCKDKMARNDFDLSTHCAQKFMVSADNYDERLNMLRSMAKVSPFYAFDIETSTPPESDEWIGTLPKKKDDRDVVDVMGSEYTGFSITFGPNMQYTYYVAVNHNEKDGVKNITKAQAKTLIQCLPRDKVMFVHNASFELPVTLNELGDMREQGNIPG